MATSEQVARLAGVSRATVSRVMNGSSHVSVETKKRIYEAIATLGYGMHPLGRTMPMQRSGLIAMALFDSVDGLNFGQVADTRSYFYLEMLKFLERELAHAGYDLLLPTRPYGPPNASDDPGTNYLLALQAKRVEGVIAMSLSTNDLRIPMLCHSSIPTVFIDSFFQGKHVTYV